MKTTLNFRPRDYVLHSNFPKGPLKHFHTIKIERKTGGVLERSLLLPTQKSSLDLSKPLLCPPPAPRGVKDQVPGLREELPLCTCLGSRTRPSASWTIRRLDHFLWGPPASFAGGGSYRWSFSASLSESRYLPAARLIRRESSGRSRRRVRMASSPPGALRSFPDTAGVLAKTPGSSRTGDTARRQGARPRREGRRAPSEAQVPDTAVSVSHDRSLAFVSPHLS